MDQRVVLPPKDTERNLCADKGYTGNPAKQVIEAHGYISHVKERGEEIKAKVTVQPLDVKKYYAAIGISLFFCSVSKDGVGRL